MSEVKINALSLAFGSHEVFRNLNHNFTPGLYIFSGPSGCGKTTLMRCITGLQLPNSGEVLLGGRRVSAFSPETHMMHQGYPCYPWLSVIDNVLMVYTAHQQKITAERRAKAVAILEQLGLQDQMHKKPHQISGGQRQRVCIAQALCLEQSRVVMFDEPTSALDRENSDLVAGLLRNYQQTWQNIIIVITHDKLFADALQGEVVVFSEAFRGVA